MIVDNVVLENIRNYSFKIHCPQIKIYQENGITLKGYGTIKINDYGVFYIEFICLEKHNIPRLDWEISLPNDRLDESQKLYLEAISITGTKFEAQDFRIELNNFFLDESSVHHVLLEKIKTVKHVQNVQDHFYIEFNQTITIPRNKDNSVISTLGSKSFSWNESIIDFDQEDLKIRIVDDLGSKGFISVEKCKNPNLILECLIFYLGFSSGLLLQPYYTKHISSNQEVNTFYSINMHYLKKKSFPAIASNLGNSEFKNGEYHFDILRSSIRLYKENPQHFLSIYAQWRRVWVSSISEQNITNLVLTTAIEGLLNDIFIPIFKKSKKDEDLDRDITEIKKIIKNLEIDNLYKERLQNSISYLKNITANKALNILADTRILKKEEIEAWKNLRNAVAHPKAKSSNLQNKYEEKEDFISCLNLFNSLILQVLSYSGPRNYFKPITQEEISLFNYKKIVDD